MRDDIASGWLTLIAIVLVTMAIAVLGVLVDHRAESNCRFGWNGYRSCQAVSSE